MDEATAKSVAAQLRKPEGEWAQQIAQFMSKGNALLIKRTIDKLSAEPHEHVLEIGMGNGAFVNYMVGENNTLQYTGYDYSSAMVEQATELNKQLVAKKQVAFVYGSADNMPFEDEAFNKIISVNTVYFWDDIAGITSEIKRVLKKDGVLVLGMRPERLMKTYPMTKYGFTMYSPLEVQQMLEVHGFTVTSIIEEDEPPQEVDGATLVLSSMIVTAVSNI